MMTVCLRYASHGARMVRLDDLQRGAAVEHIEADLRDTDRNVPAPVAERAEAVAGEIDLSATGADRARRSGS